MNEYLEYVTVYHTGTYIIMKLQVLEQVSRPTI